MGRARTELIHCENCGEDYAATYRRCPFCDAKPGGRSSLREPEPEYEEPFDDDDELLPRGHQGGKRLAGGQNNDRRGSDRDVVFWLKIGLYAVSAVVIIAAIWIICSLLLPRLFGGRGGETQATEEPVAPPVQQVEPVGDVGGDVSDLPAIELPGGEVDDPLSLDSPDLPDVDPDPIAVVQPAEPVTPQAPDTPAAPVSNARLSSTDFTINAKYPDPVRLKVTGGEAASWKSSNTNVATVDDTGLVTGVGNGSARITCTLADGSALTCDVHVAGKSGQSVAPATQAPANAPATQAPAATGSASLNHTDFTINAKYPDPVRLKVKNGEAAGWASSNTGVATVSDNGTVTGVGNGSAKITCTLADGSKLTATVHVADK